MVLYHGEPSYRNPSEDEVEEFYKNDAEYSTVKSLIHYMMNEGETPTEEQYQKMMDTLHKAGLGNILDPTTDNPSYNNAERTLALIENLRTMSKRFRPISAEEAVKITKSHRGGMWLTTGFPLAAFNSIKGGTINSGKVYEVDLPKEILKRESRHKGGEAYFLESSQVNLLPTAIKRALEVHVS